MTRKLIALGAAAALTAGMTGAAFAADRYAAPRQPVPYSQLNAYMKGSMRQRAAIISQGDGADAMPTPASSSAVNSSATMPAGQAMPGAMPMQNASPSSMPASSSSADVAAPTTGSPTNPTTPR